jgi:hypothetical protein
MYGDNSIHIPVKLTQLLGIRSGDQLALSWDGESFKLQPLSKTSK